MSRAHWIPDLLAQVRGGWTVHGIEFPPEDVRGPVNRKVERSATPPGFSQAFFEANP
jgi:hypothetical protein